MGYKTEFYAFHDNATDRARIHEGQCIYCQHGRGITRPELHPNPSLWSGPVDTLTEAEKIMDAFAAHNEKPDVGHCQICIG